MAQPFKQLYTSEEYLALEEKAERKSEYYMGEIFMMAGGSENHNLIVLNIGSQLKSSLKGKPCKTYVNDMKVQVEQNNFYTYPDVVVVCGERKFASGRSDTITNPNIIFEVLSKSTASYDRTTKFELYNPIPSLEYYILVDQKRIYVQTYQRQTDGSWVLRTYTQLAEIIKLEGIELELPLTAIYDEIDFRVRKLKRPRLKRPTN